jgi:hypothetical protein
MKLKKLLAVAVAAAFALPLAAQASAGGDRLILASGPSGTSSVGSGPTGGTPSPQSAGEPKAPMAGERGAAVGAASAPDFSAIDKNNDGQISRAEWDAHYRSGSAAAGGAAAGGATTPGKTGTTAGPGESSPKTAPSSDTATSPSTGGTGKAQ